MFYHSFQALLVSEPEVFGSAAFHQAMKEFLLLANADEDSAIEIKVSREQLYVCLPMPPW